MTSAGRLAEHRLNVDQYPGLVHQRVEPGKAPLHKPSMRHCDDGHRRRIYRSQWLQNHTVFPPDLLRIGQRVAGIYCQAVTFKLGNQGERLGISRVGAVLLESHAKQVDCSTGDGEPSLAHQPEGLVGNELGHIIVDAPAGQDHLRVIVNHLCLVRQVVGVHPDAVSAYQPGLEGEEVPLAPSRCQYI